MKTKLKICKYRQGGGWIVSQYDYAAQAWRTSHEMTYSAACAMIKTARDADLGRRETRAAVIAAAPELLDALKECIALYDGRDDEDVPGYIMDAREAIGKAEGRS